jgi:hypothetical protein
MANATVSITMSIEDSMHIENATFGVLMSLTKIVEN